MLGDNPEKPKNPLKKAMRRRQAKIVTFTAPTYHEPSDIDWSDVEEEPISAEGEAEAAAGKRSEQASQEESVQRQQDPGTEAQAKDSLQGANTSVNTGERTPDSGKSAVDERPSEDSMNSEGLSSICVLLACPRLTDSRLYA